jgi:Rieske Fe-S protein
MPREGFWLAPQDRLKVYASLGALAAALVSGAAFLAVLISFSWTEADLSSPSARIYAGTVDQFEVGQPVTFVEGMFHLVKREDGSFAALYWKSPHRGCTVPWREAFDFMGQRGWFRDPCYGSTWSVNGERVFGPSARDMDQFPVEIVGDKVYIHAGEMDLIPGKLRLTGGRD